MRKKISLIILGMFVFLGLANPGAYADTDPVQDDQTLGEPVQQYYDWTTMHDGYGFVLPPDYNTGGSHAFPGPRTGN